MLAAVIIIATIFVILARNERLTKSNDIEILVRQSARYAVAAQQDESPLIAMLHANYAAAYFYAVRDIATDREILEATKIDIREFRKHLMEIQDFTSKRSVNLCPEFGGEVDKYLAKIAGEA